MSPPSARRPWASLMSLFLFLDLAASQTATYKFTSTPTNFQGYWIANPTSVKVINCASTATWVTSSSYGACCVASEPACNIFTACNGGVLTHMDGSTWKCASDFPSCFAMTVYPNSPNVVAQSSWLAMACAKNWSVNTVYREIIPTTVSAVTRTVTHDATTVTPDATTVTPDATTITASGAPHTATPGASPGRAQPTGTAPPAAASTAGEPSKAWMAGAVLGPLVVVAAAVFLYIWLVGRRGDKGANGAQPQQYAAVSVQDPSMYGDTSSEHTAKHASEMPVYYHAPGEGPPQQWYHPSQPPPASPPPVHELTPAAWVPHELPERGSPGGWR